MKTVFRASFGRDVKRIRSDRILAGVRQAILDAEAATNWNEVPNIKKIKGADNAFRIRVDDIESACLLKTTLRNSYVFCPVAKSIASFPDSYWKERSQIRVFYPATRR